MTSNDLNGEQASGGPLTCSPATRPGASPPTSPKLPELLRGSLLEARKAIEKQVGDLDRKVHRLARHDVQVRRFMSVPGVGPITALCFKATINDPTTIVRPAGFRWSRNLSTGADSSTWTR